MSSADCSMSSSFEDDRIRLPGFGRELCELHDQTEQFSALRDWNHMFLTLRERWMLTFINEVTDKPNWTQKVFNDNVTARWEAEVLRRRWDRKLPFWSGLSDMGDAGEEELGPPDDFTKDMFEQSIVELRIKAALYEKHGIIPIFDSNACVLKSDRAIPAKLKNDLKEAVARLENVPEEQKDWHPGTNQTVLDLVHPSLYPLVYGRTRGLRYSTIDLNDCLQNPCGGDIIPIPEEEESFWSQEFQWLPCNVSFPDGEHAKIVSYINNLHPCDHRDLYSIIEKILDCIIPFWNIILQSCPFSGPIEHWPRCSDDLDHYCFSGRLPRDENRTKVMKAYDRGKPSAYESPLTSEHITNKFAFLENGEKKIQVIIKLANIILTPEKPEYEGGNWHVEGMLNEHIVSSAIYYYDNENITDSHLSFSTKIGEGYRIDGGLHHEDVDYDGLEQVFGFRPDDEYNFDFGPVKTREDRLIAFPNGFLHKVGGFKLADPTKPGHRKILAMFLVAPQDPILSTANVPPQRHDWFMRELNLENTRLAKLSRELIYIIMGYVEGHTMSLEEAQQIRLKLMEERSLFESETAEEAGGGFFNLCEH